MNRLITGVCLWLAAQGLALAGAIDFQDVRLWAAPDHTRVVFDTSGSVTPKKVFPLQNPDRLVIDVPAAQASKVLQTGSKAGGLLKGIRCNDTEDDRDFRFNTDNGDAFCNLCTDIIEMGCCSPNHRSQTDYRIICLL